MGRRQLLVNGALLALALGTLGVVWATRETPTTAELASRRGKLLPSFDKSSITRLGVSTGAKTVVLEPAPGAPNEFRIVAPWQERADIATVNRLLGALDLASSLRPADGVSSQAAGLSESAPRLRIERGDSTQVITLGGAAPSPPGARYVEVTHQGDTKRYVVSEGVASELSFTLDQFREPLLLEYGRSELHRIRIDRGGSKLELEQRGRGEIFALFPDGPELADRDAVDAIATALSRLSADRFLEPREYPASSFRRALKVEVQPSDTKQPKVSLTFGDECPEASERILLLREQQGRGPRLGCVPEDVLPPLMVEASALRLQTLFAARSDEVEELRVKRGDRMYVLLRKDAGFRLRTPLEQSVSLDAGNERISAILQARGERQPRNTERASLGLAAPEGELFVQVTSSSGSREERAQLGQRRVDGSVCLERALDHVVLCFSAETAKLFEPDATLLRPLSVLSFAPSELSTLTTTHDNFRQSVVRQADGSYRLVEPTGYAHDGSLIADAVQTLGTLSASRWVALGDEPRFELARPRLTVNLTFAADAPARELRVGAATGAGYFAQLSPEPAVFVLPQAAFADLSLPFIDRALCPFTGDDLAAVTVESKFGRGLISGQKVDFPSRGGEASEAIRSLRAYRVLHVGPARPNEGLGAPRLQIRYRAASGKQVTVLVGGCDDRDDPPFCYARRSDVDATFALSSRIVSDLVSATSHD